MTGAVDTQHRHVEMTKSPPPLPPAVAKWVLEEWQSLLVLVCDGDSEHREICPSQLFLSACLWPEEYCETHLLNSLSLSAAKPSQETFKKEFYRDVL